ncbi:unnamed protein product [Rotaria sordida]|uniref:Uncharacterized protein n=1 Tax=Rotaria sordida TaxID=392033 RepID=A0A815LEB8_9BILA|nr:unnamed protein product [Rotaria sordida]CAF1626796.1 unnamed protein product [Rotaria sordida]
MNTLTVLLFCATLALLVFEAVAFESVAERTNARANIRAKQKVRECRCTFRNAPQELMNICPDRVYASNDQNDVGACQKDAKNTAPVACRQYYGHCGWLQ